MAEELGGAVDEVNDHFRVNEDSWLRPERAGLYHLYLRSCSRNRAQPVAFLREKTAALYGRRQRQR
jgi:hypothetical protein